MMIKTSLSNFFTKSKDIKKASFIWNIISSVLFSCQSAFMLIIIPRVCGQADAGVFSISYSVASMMAYIGDYGVRKYQASDVNEECKFADYYVFRIITCSVMILVSVIYAIYGRLIKGYTTEKFIIMVIICLNLTVYAGHELYYGRLQQLHRLDIASKTSSFRTGTGILFFTAALLVSRNLLISVLVWLVATFLGFFTSITLVKPELKIDGLKGDRARILKIAKDCFPLFLGMFLLMYIGNAPKYAIDTYLNDVIQAKYSYIFMPVFVIGLMANFIFNPILVDLADSWDNRDYKTFNRLILRNVITITLLTALAILVALTIGCPVLGMLYNADLSDVKLELAILMIGGGMLAASNFIIVLATIIRAQRKLVVGYVLIAVLALLLSGTFVGKYGLRGAALLYTTLLTSLAFIFAAVLSMSIRKRKREVSS